MGKKCTVCGAPSLKRKCEYCGGRVGKDEGANQTETSNTTNVDEIQQHDSSAVSPYQTGSSLTKRKNFILIGVYIAGMFLLPMLVVPIIVLIRGYTMEYFQGDGFFNVITFTNFIVYGILCTVLLLLTREVFKQDFQKISSWGNFFKQMGLGLLCTFGAALVGNTIVMLLGTDVTSLNQELVEAALAAMPVIMIITIVLFAPVVEEVIFRLVLMNLFNWKPIYNLIFSSLIFGLIHVLVGGLIHIIPYFLMGLVFGYFYLKNNNIWHITVLHILHNGLTVVLVFWAQRMQYMLDLY